MGQSAEFDHVSERFADVRMLRYQVPGFEKLSLERKQLLYYLYEAALFGRDMIWDQNYRYNLLIRNFLEAIVRHYDGDRQSEAFKAVLAYTKRVWFSNGIHHHYSGRKFKPGFDFETLAEIARSINAAHFPLQAGADLNDLLSQLQPILFDPHIDAKKVNKDAEADVVADSAVNFYQGVTQAEVNAYHQKLSADDGPEPLSHGLNSTLVKDADGNLQERVWRVGGLYGEALEKICTWLERALPLAENDLQRQAWRHLLTYYREGDLKAFDQYNVAWVGDTSGQVDAIHGFIEVYSDPIGFRGTFEAVVSVVDPHATERIRTIADNASWFESHSPIDQAFKKDKVVGVSGKVINVVIEAGDCAPSSPIGINLPNADWIREQHGSKSVNLANIVTAHNAVRGELLTAFAASEASLARHKAYGELADNLHTDLHEVIGHGSGKLVPGVAGPSETLKNYASTIEEARADLVALYYMLDPQLITLGLMPNLDVGKAAYDHFMLNGLMLQLRRLEPGGQLEEDHMRNRQLIAAWVYQHGLENQVVDKQTRDGKTYFVINDYQALRQLFSRLLKEIQRIKSEGDFAAAKALVETYGVKVDAELHREVLARVAELDVASFHGFIQPRLVPSYKNGDLADIAIEYPDDFSAQMLEYADRYRTLPITHITAPVAVQT